MKNVTAVIVSMVLAATMVFAQEGALDAPQKKPLIGIGIKADIGFNTFYGFDEQDDDVDGNPYGLTFGIGATAKLNLVEHFAFAPEFIFSYLKAKHNYMNMERSYARFDLDIPLLFRGEFLNRFYASFGPQINLNLSNETRVESISADMEEKIDQAGIEFGICVGFGVNIVDKLFFDFRAYMGLTEIFPDVDFVGDDEFDAKKSDNWALINMAGAKVLKIKGGFSYWFI